MGLPEDSTLISRKGRREGCEIKREVDIGRR